MAFWILMGAFLITLAGSGILWGFVPGSPSPLARALRWWHRLRCRMCREGPPDLSHQEIKQAMDSLWAKLQPLIRQAPKP